VTETRRRVVDVAARAGGGEQQALGRTVGAFKTFRRDRCYANQ
jgi:hypothetical protein